MSVNELSTATFTVQPFNEDGDNQAPSTARYRIDDKASSAAIIGWTSLTPAASMDVVVPASAHAMINASAATEVRVLTVETDAGTDQAHVEEYEYEVRNLQFVG